MVEAAATEATLRTVVGGWSTAAGGRCQPCQREGGVGGAAGMGRMRCASSLMAHGRDSGEESERAGGMEGVPAPAAVRGRYWGARRSRVCDALEPEKLPAPGMERSPDPGETGKSGSN
jgi:hypothetical protein